jgi:hypothetical protein
MSARNVVVVMPFGGSDHVQRRRAILNFKRLEYLVRNRCKVRSAGSISETDCVVYGVEVAKTAMDEIPDRALRQIQNADILIALVNEPNPNVIYEVAYRRAKDRAVVLVVDSVNNLPLYLKSLAHHSWKQDDILNRIDKIASDPAGLPNLPDFAVGIPNDLKETIDIHDGELGRGLQEALQDIESKFEPEPIQAVHYLHGIVSAETSSFYPCSIVEVGFARRGEFLNPEQPAVVRNFDEGFSRLFGYVDKKAAEADRPLNLNKLLGRMEKFTAKKDWDDFIAEQVALTESVIRQYGFARVTVPLRINRMHPRSEYRTTSYLPCIISQVIDGSLDGPHRMHLLVVYIELSDVAELKRSAA